MNTGLSNVTSFLGVLLGMFGMGNSAISQWNAAKTMQPPPAQVQNVRCPSYAPTPEVQQLPDGSYRVVCVENPPQNQPQTAAAGQ
jgi:hypothetical protein